MVPDRQKVWTDGRSQNYIPPTSSGDNYCDSEKTIADTIGIATFLSM